MRAVIQRVSEASVTTAEGHSASIGRGLVVLLGVAKGDTEAEADWLAAKIANLRIFADEAGKMNRSLVDVGGGALVVSQFTLQGDCSKGRRPGFDRAGDPAEAERLYERFAGRLAAEGVAVERGVFGAYMQVSLVNDGPVTFVVDREPSP